MIQRKQTLFLFELIFLGIALLFVPSGNVATPASSYELYLVPINNAEIHSSPGHYAAIFINFTALVLAFVAVFLYRQRTMQMKLCYVMLILWTVLTLMIAFCPFVNSSVTPSAHVSYLAVAIGAFGMLAAYLAARYIKKDIELLKSADRIR
jgi:hypothetical protein